MTPRDPSAATAPRSGRTSRTVCAWASSTTRSLRARAKARTVGAASVPASRPSVAASDGGAGSGVVGSAGKSISIQPSSAREHTRTPLLVWNVPAPPST